MEDLCQVIPQATRFSFGVIAAIADEDAVQCGSPEANRAAADEELRWLRGQYGNRLRVYASCWAVAGKILSIVITSSGRYSMI
jgi:hypothetical protein